MYILFMNSIFSLFGSKANAVGLPVPPANAAGPPLITTTNTAGLPEPPVNPAFVVPPGGQPSTVSVLNMFETQSAPNADTTTFPAVAITEDKDKIEERIRFLNNMLSKNKENPETAMDSDGAEPILDKSDFKSLYIELMPIFNLINNVKHDLIWELLPETTKRDRSPNGSETELGSVSALDDSSAQGADAEPQGLGIKYIISILSLYLTCLDFANSFMTRDNYCNSVNSAFVGTAVNELDDVYVSLTIFPDRVTRAIEQKINELKGMDTLNTQDFEYQVNLENLLVLMNKKDINVSLRNFYEILLCLCSNNFELTPNNNLLKSTVTINEGLKIATEASKKSLLGLNEHYFENAFKIHEAYEESLKKNNILAEFARLNKLETKANATPKGFQLPKINNKTPNTKKEFEAELNDAKTELFKTVITDLKCINDFKIKRIDEKGNPRKDEKGNPVYVNTNLCGSLDNTDFMLQQFQTYLGDCTIYGEIRQKRSPLKLKLLDTFNRFGIAYMRKLCLGNIGQSSHSSDEDVFPLSQGALCDMMPHASFNAIDVFDQLIRANIDFQEKMLGYEKRINEDYPGYQDRSGAIESSIGTGNDTLQQQINNAKILLNKYEKMLFDLLDLTHDINCHQPFLVDILKLLCPGDNDKLQTINEMFVSPKSGEPRGVIAVRQQDIRVKREEMVDNDAKNLIRLAGLCLPDLSLQTLDREESHMEFFKSCFDNKSISGWLYKESGRILEVVKLIAYYKSLGDENKTDFKDKCILLSGCSDDDFKFFVEMPVDVQKEMDKKNNVPLLAITHFDGCGSKIQDISRGMCSSEFDNVMGFFKYSVFSNKINDNKIGHLVVVTMSDKSVQPDILAIFCFNDKVTLNSLIAEASNPRFGGINIPRRGCGEPCVSSIFNGSISSFISEYEFNNFSHPMLDNIKHMFSKTKLGAKSADNSGAACDASDITGACGIYFDEAQINFVIGEMQGAPVDNPLLKFKQTLLLLNKTIGDLIFSAYPSIREITTVDGLVVHSVKDNFLKGKTSCLAKVLRKGKNGSTIMSPGVFEQDPKIMSQKILNNMIIYCYICDYLIQSNLVRGEDLELTRRALQVFNDKRINIAGNLPLYRVQMAVNHIFRVIPTAASKTTQSDEPTYKKIMLELIYAENQYIQRRLFEIFRNIIENAEKNAAYPNQFYKFMYSLPDLLTVFRSNSFNDTTINEADINFDEFKRASPYLSDVELKDDECILKFIAPGQQDVDTIFKEIYKQTKDAILPDDYFTKNKLQNDASNSRVKRFEYTIKVNETIEFLMQMYNSPDIPFKGTKLDDHKKMIQTQLLLFFKPRVYHLNQILEPYGVQVNSTLMTLLNEQFGIPELVEVDENVDECGNSSSEVCSAEQSCSSVLTEQSKNKSSMNAKRNNKRGGSKSNRASTRGKKLKYKRFTKRPTRRRSSLKQRTIKHYRKKHNTRRRYK